MSRTPRIPNWLPWEKRTGWFRRAFRGLAIPVSIQRLTNLASDTDALQLPKVWRGRNLAILFRRLIRKRLVQLRLGFHYFGLHRRHDVRHVGAELLHCRFPDGRTVKIC